MVDVESDACFTIATPREDARPNGASPAGRGVRPPRPGGGDTMGVQEVPDRGSAGCRPESGARGA